MSSETQAAVEAAREDVWRLVPPSLAFERALAAHEAAVRADERARYEALVEAVQAWLDCEPSNESIRAALAALEEGADA